MECQFDVSGIVLRVVNITELCELTRLEGDISLLFQDGGIASHDQFRCVRYVEYSKVVCVGSGVRSR